MTKAPTRSSDRAGRPVIDAELNDLVAAIALGVPELAHVRADKVLFVAGASRNLARASIRPLSFGSRHLADYTKPIIEIDAVRILYEICLRPRFFLDASVAQRLEIVVHELWHCSPRFDGTLEDARRHGAAEDQAIDRIVAPLADRFRSHGDMERARFLDFPEEVRMRAWRIRPPSRIPIGSSLRTTYDERDLFLDIVKGKQARDG